MDLLSSLLVPGAWIGVIGSRNFPCPSLVESFVADLPSGCVVVSGADSSGLRSGKSVSSCGGIVDACAWSSSLSYGLLSLNFPPEWNRFGRGAGLVRNPFIVACGISVLVVFLKDPKRPSSGSLSTIKIAKSCGVPVFVFGPNGDGFSFCQLTLF